MFEVYKSIYAPKVLFLRIYFSTSIRLSLKKQSTNALRFQEAIPIIEKNNRLTAELAKISR